MITKKILLAGINMILLSVLIHNSSLLAQDRRPGFNYDESNVPKYELPALLISNNGQKITSKEMWEDIRRDEVLKHFKDNVYGNFPEGSYKVNYKLIKQIDSALDGKSIYKEVLITFSRKRKKQEAVLSIFLPKGGKKAAPLFISLNVSGNQSVHSDPYISITDKWITTKDYAPDNVAT